MAQVFSIKKIILIVIIIIIATLSVMLWYGCFFGYDFRFDISTVEIYRIEVWDSIRGDRVITNRSEIQRIVRRLNSYSLIEGVEHGWMPGGETPGLELRFLDLNEDVTLQIAMWVGYIMVTGSCAENAGLRGWHRIRGVRGWFAPRALG